MRVRTGLHHVFTREVLEEIPTAMLAITNQRVTSFSKKKKKKSGRLGEVWVVRGGGEWKPCEEEGEKHFVTGYHRLISHEHLLEERVWCLSWECLCSHLHTHLHTHTFRHCKQFFSVSYFCLFAWSSCKGSAALKRFAHARISGKRVSWCAYVCVCVLQSPS